MPNDFEIKVTDAKYKYIEAIRERRHTDPTFKEDTLRILRAKTTVDVDDIIDDLFIPKSFTSVGEFSARMIDSPQELAAWIGKEWGERWLDSEEAKKHETK